NNANLTLHRQTVSRKIEWPTLTKTYRSVMTPTRLDRILDMWAKRRAEDGDPTAPRRTTARPPERRRSMHTRTERILIISVIPCGWASLAFVGPAPVHAAPDKQVTVDNTAANPVIVRDVDNPARHFFQASTGTLTNAFNPSGFGSTLTDVLGGQVLVI